MRAQARHKAQEIVFTFAFGHVVLSHEDLQNLLQGPLLLKQMPHPRPDRIKTEINTPLQIQNHNLPLEVMKNDVFGDSYSGGERNVLGRQVHRQTTNGGIGGISTCWLFTSLTP